MSLGTPPTVLPFFDKEVTGPLCTTEFPSTKWDNDRTVVIIR